MSLDQCPECNGTKIIDINVQGFRDPYPCPLCTGGKTAKETQEAKDRSKKAEKKILYMKRRLNSDGD